MAHSLDEAEAVDVQTSLSMDDAASAFEDDAPEDEFGEEEEFEDELEEEAEDAEAEDEDDDDDEQEDEPETAIDAPASLNAEEKAAFAQLPPEAQKAWAASENRRNTQVQEATTKASEAQRQAESRAAAADAEAQRVYAQQLKQIGESIAPQMPDASQYADTQSYLLAEAQYRSAKAQHDEFMQQVQTIEAEADTQDRKVFFQERDRVLATHPQIANPETQGAYVSGVIEFAKDAGFAPDEIVNHATGEEFLAIAKVYDRVKAAEEKAAKYDALQKGKMKKVRAAKRNLRPGAAQSQGSGKRRANDKALNAFQKNPSSMAAAAEVFGD